MGSDVNEQGDSFMVAHSPKGCRTAKAASRWASSKTRKGVVRAAVIEGSVTTRGLAAFVSRGRLAGWTPN